MEGKETLSYEEITNTKNNMIKISTEMSQLLDEAKRLVAECENEGIFVTDLGSKTMQQNFTELAASFGPFIEKLNEYATFLTDELNVTYNQTDIDLSNVWKNVLDAMNAGINN